MQMQLLRTIGRVNPVSFELVLLGAVLIQGLHFAEHIAQVSQKFFLELPEAHGILGNAFDTEWVHFVYNAMLFAVMLFLVIAKDRRQAQQESAHWYSHVLVFGFAVQGYHMLEHTIKLFQHVTVACSSCPGLLGSFINLIWLHFGINLLVFLLITMALVGFKISVYSESEA